MRHIEDWRLRALSCRAAGESAFHLSGDEPQYLTDREFETKHIKLVCEFDLEAKRVIGTAFLTLQPYAGGLRHIVLDSEDTEIKKITLDDAELQHDHCDGKLTVKLSEPRADAEPFTVQIAYVAEPRKGLYFTGPDADYPDKPVQIWTQGQDTDNHFWFPCVDEPKGRITSEIICAAPADWTVVSNGRLVATNATADGRKQFHWLQDKPHAVYLITLVAGKFNRVVLQDADPPIDFYCEPGREADAGRAFENTVAMIKFFSELTAEPYPWDKYTQIAVQDFIFGGMENTSATTQTDMTLHDETAHKDFSSDYLVAHEAAHQWFGDLITCREWPHGWLNESFATFLEALWQENHRGRDEYLWDIQGMMQTYLAEDYRRPIVERKYAAPVDIFDRHLYEKGAIVLHMLRNELGRERFYRALRHYVRANRDRNVMTPDFQRAIEEATGRNLDWFFDQWIFKPGHPDFKVVYKWDAAAKQATLEVEQKQETPFRCSVEIAFLLESGRVVYQAQIGEKRQTLTYDLDAQPQAAQFDAGFGILKTIDFERPYEMLIYQARNDDDAAGRIEAARALGKHNSRKAVACLRALLADGGEFYGVQIAAAEALANIRSDDARDALLANVGAPNLKARRAVAVALGAFQRDQAVAAALRQTLNSADSYYVAAAAASALGKLRLDDALAALKEALGRPSHLDAVTAGALAGIGAIESDAAFDIVCEWTRRGHPQRARVSAVGALGDKVGQHKRRQAIDILTPLLDDGWFQVRVAAVGALQALEARESVPALRRLIQRELDARVARLARRAIDKINASGAAVDKVKELQTSLEDMKREHAQLAERVNKLEKDDRQGK